LHYVVIIHLFFLLSDFVFERQKFAANNLQKRRLASAIVADEAGFPLSFKGKQDVVDRDDYAVRFVNFICFDFHRRFLFILSRISHLGNVVVG
jgi:hypothetical protein